MEQATYVSRLRYLAADDVDDSNIDFDSLEVRGHDDTKLGDIDGFIVDGTSGRLYHIVVDSGGWFSSRRFLLPAGHATVDRDAQAVRVDVNKDALKRYPEFDEERFRQFSDEDLRAFERRTLEACCPSETIEDVSVGTWQFDTHRHYAQPAWWASDSYPRERLRTVDTAAYRTPSSGVLHDRELVTARQQDDPERYREEHGEDSPHFEGRAQPGDVLGLETGGERTYVGDTAEDENKRRRNAEETVPEDDEPKRSER